MLRRFRAEKAAAGIAGGERLRDVRDGKWHNGQDSWLRAFQRGKTVMFGGMSDHTKVPVRDRGADGKLTAERTNATFSSEMFADSAIGFLREHKGENLSSFASRSPRRTTRVSRRKSIASVTTAIGLPLPENFLPQLPFDNGMMKGGRDENLGAWPRTESMIRDQLADTTA